MSLWDKMLANFIKTHYGRNGKCLCILATCVLITCIVYLTNETYLNIPQVNRVRHYIERFISNEQRTTIRQSEVKQDIEKFKRNHFMTVNGEGRLGNQMFQVAALMGTAFRYNYTPIIPPHYHLLYNSFDLLQLQNIQMNNAGIFHEKLSGTYDINIESLSYGKNWTLNGFFQSWKYFNNYRENIIALFQFNDRIKSKAIKVLKGLVKDGMTSVGVHIRRGDKAQLSEIKLGNNVATSQYMMKALQFFRKNTTNPMFVVISDDRLWPRAHVKGPDVTYAVTGSPEIDMAILTLCNHTIITVGTFGWWGAYINGGITVYFSNYPRRGSYLATKFDNSGYYLPEWIGME